MDTPVSLLERLRRPASDGAWTRFVGLYAPVLHAWARRTGCRETEAADLSKGRVLSRRRELDGLAD